MKHLGDITRLNGAEIEPVDVVTGGSPCQDLSVAGKQAGLNGERSGLFYEQMRLVREMREATGGVYPRFMIWENVPGATSTNKGADFREVLNECVKIVEEAAPDVPMPEKGGWPNAGVLYDDLGGWSIAWRIHDAQFWGVPQRRRRIALVCDFRGMRAPEVLFEREGVSGNFETCDPQRQGAAGNSGGSPAEADAGRVVAVHQNSRNELRLSDTAYALTAEQGAKPGQSLPVIAYQLVGVNSNSMKSSNPHSGCYETEAAGTITASGYEPNNQGGTCIVECRVYDARGNGNGSTAATVTGDHESRITNVVVHAAAYGFNGDNHESGMSVTRERSHALRTTTKEQVCAPKVFATNGALSRFGEDTVSCLTACEYKGVNNQNNIVARAPGYAVRRLTPLECTRLQGYPDGWVDIGDWTDTKGKMHKEADGPKYKALGNSIALPFWKWLLERIYKECKSPDPTLGSLFDGIGGFPLSWPGRTAWSSEIEEFPLAVLRARFANDDDVNDCCKQPPLPFEMVGVTREEQK